MILNELCHTNRTAFILFPEKQKNMKENEKKMKQKPLKDRNEMRCGISLKRTGKIHNNKFKQQQKEAPTSLRTYDSV